MYEAYTPPPPTYNIYGMPMNRPSRIIVHFMVIKQHLNPHEEVTIDGQQFRTVKPE
jgi:hypothetical protein